MPPQAETQKFAPLDRRSFLKRAFISMFDTSVWCLSRLVHLWQSASSPTLSAHDHLRWDIDVKCTGYRVGAARWTYLRVFDNLTIQIGILARGIAP